MNPVYKKELKQAARTKRTALLILFYNMALALFGLFGYYLSYSRSGTYQMYVDYSKILTIYLIITAIEAAIFLFLIPALTAGAVTGEREKQTLDILLTTRISAGKIVTGKLFSSISILLLLSVSSMPVISIVFSVGGIRLWNIAEFFVFLFITAVYIGSIGIFFSCSCRKTTTSTVCSYSAMLFLSAGTGMLFFAAAVIHNYSASGNWDFKNMLWYSKDAGHLIYLLLLNPFAAFISMIKEQTGFFSDIFHGITASGRVPLSISKRWFEYSMFLQFLVSLLMLRLAVYKITRVKNRK